MEFKFKVGDIVRQIGNDGGFSMGDIATVVELRTDYSMTDPVISLSNENSSGRHVYQRFYELVSSNSNLEQNKMEKKVFSVLVVDKKTGKTIKNDDAVVALNEQDALLSAFGVKAEDSFIKIQEVGKFEVKEPVQAIIVKTDKQ